MESQQSIKSSAVWIDEIPSRNGGKATVNAISFRPDGTQLIAGVESRVLLYDVADGSLVNSLKGTIQDSIS